MEIINLEQIKSHLDIESAILNIETGFAAYSKGDVVVPPVGHLPFDDGDCHIKYGYIKDDPWFVIKVATGFSQNRKKGLATCSGLMLIMDAQTGYPVALLQDEGILTEIRTAMAGLIASKYLAPRHIKKIGIVGSGGQAHYQLEYLRYITDCREVCVWNRDLKNAEAFAADMEKSGFNMRISQDLKTLAQECNLIVMTTPSTQPLLKAEWIKKGTHITAMGADAPGKQELDEKIVEMADICAVDSCSQCMDHGEISTAFKKGLIREDKLIELGQIISTGSKARTDEKQITLADLTGVAVQDIKITLSVYESYLRS